MPPEGLHRIEDGLRASLHPIDSGATEESAVSYDSDASAIFAAFTTPPTTARKGLINTCVLALKSGSVWTKLDALYMFAAADSQAALINWKQPGTYNGTLVNAPTHTADQGFVGASTKYVDSGFNPSTASTPKYVRDSATLVGWSLTNTNTTNTGFIGFPTLATMQMCPRAGSNLGVYQANSAGSSTVASVTDGSGCWAASRSASTTLTPYKNGSSAGSATTASTAVSNENIVFLRRTSGYWNGTMALGGFGASLSSGEHTSLYDALHVYLQTVAGVA